jgi:hypothetical protein
LRFSARLDDVSIRVGADELDRVVEGREVLLRNDRDADGLQLFLAEGAIVLEAIAVGRAADDQLALLTELLRLGALSEDIVRRR